MKIAALGECLIELTESGSMQFNSNFAGDTYNTLYYLNRLNPLNHNSYVSALGRDPYSQQMLKCWQQQGLDTSLCLRFDDRLPGLYLVKTDPTGEREFYYYRSESAASRMFEHPSMPEVLEALLDYDLLIVSGISFAILAPPARQCLLEAMARMRQNGCKIAFDTNYRQKLWSGRASFQSLLKNILPIVDYLFVTFADDKMLYDDIDLSQAERRYQQSGVPLVVIKDGASPTTLLHAGQVRRFPARPVKNVIDTTGAGDAFNAGFLSQIVKHESIEAAVECGHRLASQVIQVPGAILATSTIFADRPSASPEWINANPA